SLFLFLLLLGAGVAGTIVVLKQGRRRLRYLTRDPRRVATACARDLAEYMHDQRIPMPRASTPREAGRAVAVQFGVDAGAFTDAVTAGRYGPLEGAAEAATAARVELRSLKRRLRRGLARRERLRGPLSV